jgi:hypothetical protein
VVDSFTYFTDDDENDLGGLDHDEHVGEYLITCICDFDEKRLRVKPSTQCTVSRIHPPIVQISKSIGPTLPKVSRNITETASIGDTVEIQVFEMVGNAQGNIDSRPTVI